MTDNAVTKMEPRQEVQTAQADPFVSMIERVVMSPDADLDKLERMLAMKERMEAQNARVSFARVRFRSPLEIPPIMKDAAVDYTNNKGQRTHYRHETLAGIAKVVDPILSRYGLSYRFRTDQGNGGVRVTCIITHSDGHFEETSLSGAPDGSGSKNSFQAVGSAVTYLQRYTLKAALGLSAEVDDDGQGAAPRDDRQPNRDEIQQRDAGRTHEKANAVSAHERTSDNMISAIRKHGAPAVEGDKSFQQDFARLKAEGPEFASRVEVELSRWHEANPPRVNADLGGDEIPY